MNVDPGQSLTEALAHSIDREHLALEEYSLVQSLILRFENKITAAFEAAAQGKVNDALDLMFQAGQHYNSALWHTAHPTTCDEANRVGNAALQALEASNAERSYKAYSRKLEAISELMRRHDASPKVSKTSHLRAMASVDNGDRWGSYRSLVDACKEIKF